MVHHPFAEHLALEVAEQGAGHSRLTLQIAPHHLNPHGVVHGAVLFALQWPRRVAVWFGYHEWWHAFVVAAGACFFAMNAYLIATA